MEKFPSASLKWHKSPVDKEVISRLTMRYGLNPLVATILVRRGICKGEDILYYEQSSLRFQHNPFLFNAMEDAVDRILNAQEEKEKVLVFGDKDVDGITATTLIWEALVSFGVKATYKVPTGEETYGLSTKTVEEFAAEGGSLIITVDCGISNVNEIAHAAELGVDVIVFDHHDPSEASKQLEDMAIVLDAKLQDSGYPFSEISGCALAYKAAQALRFSKSDWYKVDAVLLDARLSEDQKAVQIDCLKMRNLVMTKRLKTTLTVQVKNHKERNRLLDFLQGMVLLCWDERQVKGALGAVFSRSVEFNLVDLRPHVAKLYPWAASASLARVASMSKISHYTQDDSEGASDAKEKEAKVTAPNSTLSTPNLIEGLYNLFVTFIRQGLYKLFPKFQETEKQEVQLVTLAALADVMPMKNENRIFVKNGIEAMSDVFLVRRGIKEIASRLGVLGKPITSETLSWKIIPALNASGRLGQADLAVRLFTQKDGRQREALAEQIVALNEKRKELTHEAEYITWKQAQDSVSQFKGKLCFVYDERINKGVAGILAGKLVSKLEVPTIVCTKIGSTVIGSMRSCRGLDATGLLSRFEDIFESYGGHFQAAGFNLRDENLSQFKARLGLIAQTIALDAPKDEITVDANVPAKFMTAELEKVVDFFEPYGHENPKLLFMAQGLTIVQGGIVGKTERMHLRITVDSGKAKWPCIFWGEGERWGRNFDTGDKVDILFNVGKNYYNGMKSLELELFGIRKSPT